MVLHRLLDEGGLPLQVLDLPFLAARSGTRRVIEKDILSSKGLLEVCQGLVAVHLVDGHEELAESREVQQEVGHREEYVAALAAHGAHQRQAVRTSQRMVAHHHGSAVGRNILQAVDNDGHAQVPRFLSLGESMHKVETEILTVLVDALVEVLDMQQPLHRLHEKTGQLDTLVA